MIILPNSVFGKSVSELWSMQTFAPFFDYYCVQAYRLKFVSSENPTFMKSMRAEDSWAIDQQRTSQLLWIDFTSRPGWPTYEVRANKCNGSVLTMLNKHFAFVEFRSDSRYIYRSFTQGVFSIKSVSKIFMRFVHINAKTGRALAWRPITHKIVSVGSISEILSHYAWL
jgi:hypothetical protein